MKDHKNFETMNTDQRNALKQLASSADSKLIEKCRALCLLLLNEGMRVHVIAKQLKIKVGQVQCWQLQWQQKSRTRTLHSSSQG
ncbi:MAG: helix-turn-helix domain-containing protein [Planctomycetes bacterium]|nr:helix-turn-helix domain-containing protein [Planctomycetota bacterium]